MNIGRYILRENTDTCQWQVQLLAGVFCGIAYQSLIQWTTFDCFLKLDFSVLAMAISKKKFWKNIRRHIDKPVHTLSNPASACEK